MITTAFIIIKNKGISMRRKENFSNLFCELLKFILYFHLMSHSLQKVGNKLQELS